jgi:hypothetical protein
MRPFMKSRLAGKIRTFRNVQDLSRAIDLQNIPSSLGGSLNYDHTEWTAQHIVSVDQCTAHSPLFEEIVSLPPSCSPALLPNLTTPILIPLDGWRRS